MIIKGFVNEDVLFEAIEKYNKDHDKIVRTIKSSITENHFAVCSKMVKQFFIKWGKGMFMGFAQYEYKKFNDWINEREKE